MLIQTYRENASYQTPFLAFCPYCKDRVRFENGVPSEVVCNCTFAKSGFSHNAVKVTTIRGRVTSHKCNAKCVASKSGVCDCSCGGKNHGKGWGQA